MISEHLLSTYSAVNVVEGITDRIFIVSTVVGHLECFILEDKITTGNAVTQTTFEFLDSFPEYSSIEKP